ncbi:MAG: hypothetical protein CMI02_08530 [Oceanospirillaceae bacterium]|nr:hypothetical protein [Oceanospirillaceae bacterium]MBT12068.1 hypothetical protein [Oceanospirillaceae bacterium]|tara:strand:- start:30062 stop:31270 length:1209 start_codon:yes stop_codon:yes gene_type:complete
MPSHPLFSDNTIALSATLAATIGLEEAVLLTVLNDAARLQSHAQTGISHPALRAQLPFWDDVSIRRVLRSLCDKGLISLQGALFPEGDMLLFNFTDHAREQPPRADALHTPAAPPAASAATPAHTKAPLQTDWQPHEDTLQRLQQHGIPRSFSWAQLDTFMLAGQEQGANRNDWNTRFFRHVKAQWVYQQNDAQRHQRALEKSFNGPAQAAQTTPGHERTAFRPGQEEAGPIAHDWQPNQDACQILTRAGIDPQFIADAVPEFVLYWAERGDAFKTWNSKFIQHVRQQWARYSASVEHSPLPTRIAENWQPSPDCFDILSMAHIDRRFAEQLVPEFVLYWRDANQVHNSWNSRFLQYVKQQWGKRLAQSGDAHGQSANRQQGAQPGYATAEASIQRLKDTSW